MNFDHIEKQLEFALEHDKNVLLIGKAGVGKTEIIKKLFDNKFGKGKWRYYSASTMDVWTDFIGCPKEVTDKESGLKYLDLIKPKDWATDSVSAIFIDEYNRGDKKTRNAIMELVQFRSINNKKFDNLKLIWGAINPDDGDYQVEELDPAQKDRFEYHIEFPYAPNIDYFVNKFGEENGTIAVNWWNCLDSKKKDMVTPRRLDKALEIILFLNGDVNNVLPKETNPGKLINELNSGSVLEKLEKILKKKDTPKRTEELEKFFETSNNYFNCKEHILKQENNYLVKYISDERLAELVSNNKQIRDFVMSKVNDEDKFTKIIDEILTADSNDELTQELKSHENFFPFFVRKEENNEVLKAHEAMLKEIMAKKDDDNTYKWIAENRENLAGSDMGVTEMYRLGQSNPKKYAGWEKHIDVIMHHGIM